MGSQDLGNLDIEYCGHQVNWIWVNLGARQFGDQTVWAVGKLGTEQFGHWTANTLGNLDPNCLNNGNCGHQVNWVQGNLDTRQPGPRQSGHWEVCALDKLGTG